MKLIITDSINISEFEPLKRVYSLEIIKAAAKKSLQRLGDNIKNPFKIPATTLSKMYLTSSAGAGRAIFLLQINNEKSVLVILRTKKDKQIGTNMTVKNQKFQKVLDKNLSLIIGDLEKGKYSEYDLD